MTSEPVKTGVFLCECGENISGIIDIDRISDSIKNNTDVVFCETHPHLCSSEGISKLKERAEEKVVNRLVVAACTPKMHERRFREAALSIGINPYCVVICNIREQCAWVHREENGKATEKADYIIRAAVKRASVIQPLETREVRITQSAMVIGGGVAGIQAALDIADNGYKVYLVESSPSIGGRMAQLDKTFPTLDCSACILTPKMVDAARHPNIELLAYCDVIDVKGHVGDFRVKVLKKPRYVNEDLCKGCGECAEACRMKDRIDNEFDCNLSKRSAIYIPFPQAVPLKYLVDPENCLLLTRGVCGKTLKCADACEAKAIDFEQKEEEIELNVGVIILATGYDPFNPVEKQNLGYPSLPQVITALDLERLVNASGPTGGHILVNGIEPKDVVFISCVGSREKDGNKYCSRFCCMYTAKLAHMVKDKIPQANVIVYYTDMRAFGKGFDEFFEKVKKEGIEYRLRDLEDEVIVEEKKGRALVKVKNHPDALSDMVVLSTGAVPRSGSGKLSELIGVKRGEDGFFIELHPKNRPVETSTRGVFLAGCCQSPKDIPDSVQQASAVAAKACSVLRDGKMQLDPLIAVVKEAGCGDCQICLSLCPFGALEFDKEKKMARVDEYLCQGCGICSAACPSGAISVRNYSQDQLEAQLEAIMGLD